MVHQRFGFRWSAMAAAESIMAKMVKFLLFELVVCWPILVSIMMIPVSDAVPADSAHRWMHQMTLDPEANYHLKWYFDMGTETITFRCCVGTRGWFALGLSPSGGMANSDIVLVWVDSLGRVHLQDRYAEDDEMPVIDEHQDWILESGYENDTHTCVTFHRAFLTCDYDSDLPVTNDVVKLIWAYHHDDPRGSSAMIGKHDHDKRGHRSVHLLNHRIDNVNEADLSRLKFWDITSNNFTLPHHSDTTYWCKIVSPSFKTKAHVVRIEPIISPAKNAPFVHHMVLYRCHHPNPDLLRDYLDQPGINCLDFANMPFDFFHCQSIYMVWATGGEGFNLPDNVGIPIFEDEETTYFMFEIHYDNPDLRYGVHDSSGLRLYYTETLREFDADTATMGSVVDYRMIIPNAFENFTASGHCSPECFRHKMPREGINVLAALPHGHKHLERIIVRHFRGSTELPPLAEENNYDFNFQDFRRFERKRIILPGDQITVECTYNTESAEKPIFGGLSTQEEMCMVFLVYYPRMKGVRTCLSGLTPETVMTLAGVERVHSIDEHDMNPVIMEPAYVANQTLSQYVLDKTDWNFRSRFSDQQLTYLVRDAPQKAQCFWRKIEDIDGLEGMEEIRELVSHPKPLVAPYRRPRPRCQRLVTVINPLANDHFVPSRSSSVHPVFSSSSSSYFRFLYIFSMIYFFYLN